MRFIRKAQALGFSLDEIKEIIGLARTGASPCRRVQAALKEKLYEVDRRLKELRDFRAELAPLIAEASRLGAKESGAQVCLIVEEASPLPIIEITRPMFSRKRSQGKGK